MSATDEVREKRQRKKKKDEKKGPKFLKPPPVLDISFSTDGVVGMQSGVTREAEATIMDQNTQWMLSERRNGLTELVVCAPSATDADDEDAAAAAESQSQKLKMVLSVAHEGKGMPTEPLHYHVAQLGKTFMLFERGSSAAWRKSNFRRDDSSELQLLPLSVANPGDTYITVVAFDPSKWVAFDGIYNHRTETFGFLTNSIEFGKTPPFHAVMNLRRLEAWKTMAKDHPNARFRNSQKWGRVYPPGQPLTLEDQPISGLRYINLEPYTDEMTILVGPSESDEIKYGCASTTSSACLVFLLKSDQHCVYICMPGTSKQTVHCAFDENIWDHWTIPVASEGFQKFLDGKPCKEGYHRCKKAKFPPEE